MVPPVVGVTDTCLRCSPRLRLSCHVVQWKSPRKNLRPMRILYVHERFGPLGGAEANILLTAQELKSRGHEVAIAFGGTEKAAGNEWLGTFSTRFSLDETPNALESALSVFNPDVVF